jgi:plastocyanin
MRRLLTCFSVLFLAWGMPAATVEGSVEVAGSGKHTIRDIVVWLQPSTPVSAAPGELPHRTLLQKDKSFKPHVLPIRVGTVVDFPNADPIFHNAFSNYDGQIFDVSLYPPGTSRAVRFRRPGIVRVFCNIHPMMSAIILVLETPYFATLDNSGRYRIQDVPSGEYEIHVFDERVTVENPAQPLKVADADVEAPVVKISESGYVPVSHRNKYGQEYPAGSGQETYGDIPR